MLFTSIRVGTWLKHAQQSTLYASETNNNTVKQIHYVFQHFCSCKLLRMTSSNTGLNGYHSVYSRSVWTDSVIGKCDFSLSDRPMLRE
jgi:hypothetical protein